MVFGAVIEPPPQKMPEMPSAPGTTQCRPPSPLGIDPEDQERSYCAAEGRATVEESRRQRALLGRKPLRDRLGCGGPIGRLTQTEEKAEPEEREKAVGKRREYGGRRIERDGDGCAFPRSDAIEETPAEKLAERIRNRKPITRLA